VSIVRRIECSRLAVIDATRILADTGPGTASNMVVEVIPMVAVSFLMKVYF
jgi:hypothetical protein